MSFIQWDFLLGYFGYIFLIFFFIILGKTITPKVVNEIKLISSGKVLDNNKTVGQCRTPFGEVAGGVIIMHVVVQPSLAKTKTGNFYFKSSIQHNNFFLCFLNCVFDLLDGYIWTPMVLNDMIQHLIWMSIEQ
jgi:hypothetical protein